MFHSDICSKLLLSPELRIEILKHQCNKSVERFAGVLYKLKKTVF